MDIVEVEGIKYNKQPDGTLVPILDEVTIHLTLDEFNLVYDLMYLLEQTPVPVFYDAINDSWHTLNRNGKSIITGSHGLLTALAQKALEIEYSIKDDVDQRFWKNLHD